MRKTHILLFTPWLLLTPALAAATTYKCVVDGQTIYSQEKCAKDAEEVEAQGKLSGVNKALPIPPGANTHVPPDTGRGTASGTKESEKKGADQAANDCASRLAAYRESQACFGRYRINANVMDPEAFNKCKTVPEPTDCLAGNTQ